MKGSEKQIQWAERIKKATIMTIHNRISDRFTTEQELRVWKIVLADVEKAFASEKGQDAAFVINRREQFAPEALDQYVEAAVRRQNR